MTGFNVLESIVIVNIVGIAVVVLLNVVFLICNYKECIKIRYMPLVFGLVNCIKESTIKKQRVYKTIKYLNICEDSVMYTRKYYYKKYSLVVWIFLIMNVLSMVVICQTKVQKQLINNQYILKPNYNKNSKNVELDISIIDDSGKIKESDIEIDVLPNRLNSFEERKLIAEVETYLHKTVKGKNKSYDRVETSLDLVTKYNKDKNISIEWKLDELGIIDYRGDINYSNLEMELKKEDKLENETINNCSTEITIKAIISYFKKEYEYPITLTVYKKQEDSYTQLMKSLKAEITKLNKKHNKNGVLKLPKKIGVYKIIYNEKESNTLISNLIIVLSVGALSIFIVIKYKDNDFKKDIDEKEQDLTLSYIKIVSKIKMLVIAGLQVETALEKICKDYLQERANNKDSLNYAYEELLYTYKDIEFGTSSIEAFRDFGKRIGMGSYIRLSSLIIQNIKNGNESFIEALDTEIKLIESKQKEMYIKKGGKMGAKLLAPMMILMVITLVIVILPALITM